MPFVYKEADCLQISSHFGGEHVLRNPFSLRVLLPRASVCICCTNERNKSFRGPFGRGERFVRENSRSKAEVGSTEWSVAMRLTVREQKTARVMET